MFVFRSQTEELGMYRVRFQITNRRAEYYTVYVFRSQQKNWVCTGCRFSDHKQKSWICTGCTFSNHKQKNWVCTGCTFSGHKQKNWVCTGVGFQITNRRTGYVQGVRLQIRSRRTEYVQSVHFQIRSRTENVQSVCFLGRNRRTEGTGCRPTLCEHKTEEFVRREGGTPHILVPGARQ